MQLFFVSICCAVTAFERWTGAADRRVALVIGNSAYAHTPALRNPANDARAIANLLKRSGFDEMALKLGLKFDSRRLTKGTAPGSRSDGLHSATSRPHRLMTSPTS